MIPELEQFKTQLLEKYPTLDKDKLYLRAEVFWKVVEKAIRFGIKTERGRPKGFDDILRDL